MWDSLADADDGDPVSRLVTLPTDLETADILLANAEEECHRLNLLIAQLEDAARDPETAIQLLELMTRTAMAIQAHRRKVDEEPFP